MAEAKKIKDEILRLLKEDKTSLEIARELGCSKATVSYHNRKHNIREKRVPNPPRIRNPVKVFTNDEVFCEGSTYQRVHIKNRIINQNLKPYVCEDCGIEPKWNGKKLVLVLDHINGVNNDNRLENLRFLCPNCNSQTDTFAGRNIRKKTL